MRRGLGALRWMKEIGVPPEACDLMTCKVLVRVVTPQLSVLRIWRTRM